MEREKRGRARCWCPSRRPCISARILVGTLLVTTHPPAAVIRAPRTAAATRRPPPHGMSCRSGASGPAGPGRSAVNPPSGGPPLRYGRSAVTADHNRAGRLIWTSQRLVLSIGENRPRVAGETGGGLRCRPSTGGTDPRDFRAARMAPTTPRPKGYPIDHAAERAARAPRRRAVPGLRRAGDGERPVDASRRAPDGQRPGPARRRLFSMFDTLAVAQQLRRRRRRPRLGRGHRQGDPRRSGARRPWTSDLASGPFSFRNLGVDPRFHPMSAGLLTVRRRRMGSSAGRLRVERVRRPRCLR